MVNYQLGKVYKIVGNGKIYVGSTCKRLLCQRLAGHNGDYKLYQKGQGTNVTSYQCLSDPNHYIELLELCPSDSKDELHKCERKYIEQLECVNKCIAGRTMKEYQEIHKEQIKEYRKEYREDNKEKIKEQSKAYREANKEAINERDKAYREANKEKIKAYKEDHKERHNELRRLRRQQNKQIIN